MPWLNTFCEIRAQERKPVPAAGVHLQDQTPEKKECHPSTRAESSPASTDSSYQKVKDDQPGNLRFDSETQDEQHSARRNIAVKQKKCGSNHRKGTRDCCRVPHAQKPAPEKQNEASEQGRSPGIFLPRKPYHQSRRYNKARSTQESQKDGGNPKLEECQRSDRKE